MQRYFEALLREKSDGTVNRFVTDEKLKQQIKMFEAAFPGYQMSLEDIIVEGDKVALRSILTGTSQGELMGIPATGKAVNVPLMLVYRIKERMMAEFWMNADTLSLLHQIGAIPPLAATH